ncbi:metallophosphoesterase 1-like [Patiria miniata]|uniref:Calcineurin-like phosphoesterase domain-containing protein n=1 Tax=Patiria miniata TaxID=46514 RepID=A0A914BKE2_PATMI|nr:metallophosphoesterase 1-like [Patiria miniata]XP_038076579.1 metallophosphoesterase 1-like [Patiria miniata]
MILLWRHLLRLILAAFSLLIFCEFLIYYFIALPCSWPQLPRGDWGRDAPGGGESAPLRAMFLSDTHLLGNRLGHWFDKLRREWQMQRAFQTAMTLANPDVVFILGDLTDEGKWASDQEFGETVERFNNMFKVGENIEFHVVVGNHDIGFHESVTKIKLERFQEMFDIPPVKILTIKDNVFVLVNSMAMHGDGCFMCSPAMDKLRWASERLNCTRYGSPSGRANEKETVKARCQKYKTLPNVRPILLQHFPLYRPDETPCTGPDAPTLNQQRKKNTERFDVISKKASQQLLSWIQPRMILSGHAHHGCYVVHPGGVPELSVPSFSWRNRNNPSLILATISKEHFEYSKCFIPQETSVITIYVFFISLIVVWFVLSIVRNWGRNFKKYR